MVYSPWDCKELDVTEPLTRTLYCPSCSFPGGSDSKESACNAGDPGSISGSGRFPWRRDRLRIPVFLGFPGGSVVKNPLANARDLSSILGSGKSPGGRNGSSFQYSCWGNPMDRGLQSLGLQKSHI